MKFMIRFTLMFISITAFITGCGIVELKVDVIQRVVVDKGDNTKDSFSKLNTKLEEGPITEEANQHTSTQHHVSSSSNDKTDSTNQTSTDVKTDIETKLY